MAFHARCFCGASRASIQADVLTIAACHCGDCRRWTGAALPVFAAFPASSIPAEFGKRHTSDTGSWRSHCDTCGSPLASGYPYLPGQVYIPIGILAEAEDLKPYVQSHAENALPWLHLDEDIPAQTGSARTTLLGG